MFLLLETSSVCIVHFRWFPLIYYQPLGSLFIHFLHSLALCSEGRLLFPGLLLKPPPTPQKTTKKNPHHMALIEDLTNILPSILSPTLPCPLGDLTQSQGSHLSQTETLPWLAFRDAGHCFLLITGHPIWGLCRVSNSVLYKTMSILPRLSQSASGTWSPPYLSHTSNQRQSPLGSASTTSPASLLTITCPCSHPPSLLPCHHQIHLPQALILSVSPLHKNLQSLTTE